jgi:hypothetical protein
LIETIDLPSEYEITSSFKQICKDLSIGNYSNDSLRTVIYEMTDGMRTSTAQRGEDAYYDGGLFCLRFIHILRILGMDSCYINVIEEKHKERENYEDIFLGLKRLFPLYQEYADEYKIQLRFLGELNESLEPNGLKGNFASELRELEKRTLKNTQFSAMFLVNYSLNWAMRHNEIFDGLPNVDVTVRHTKFQFPTGMMLPPTRSDFSSLVYVQQGSSGTTWSNSQILTLIALSIRSKILNSGTQYLRTYTEGEKEYVRKEREENLYFVQRRMFIEKELARIENLKTFEPEDLPFFRYPPRTKRAILAGTPGPEIYEF